MYLCHVGKLNGAEATAKVTVLVLAMDAYHLNRLSWSKNDYRYTIMIDSGIKTSKRVTIYLINMHRLGRERIKDKTEL